MLDLPQRRAFATRDEFAAAMMASFHDLYARYDAEQVRHAAPEWAHDVGCYSISLPIAVAEEGGAPHGVANIVKHAALMNKTVIGRLARVERDGLWVVYFEAK